MDLINGDNNFVFAEVSQELVRDTMTSMPTKKTPGHDKIGMNAIKACLPSILPVITNLTCLTPPFLVAASLETGS